MWGRGSMGMGIQVKNAVASWIRSKVNPQLLVATARTSQKGGGEARRGNLDLKMEHPSLTHTPPAPSSFRPQTPAKEVAWSE